ncbi:putative 26S proteasome regulatory subunit rpn9 [Ceratocystis platani]|uniref:Putative 26S proteasome regulatory subunit rpn9 n=1 Tax=Ceratocystis fimbriata f. sp. platani TaxID=88771 RepID=A0A0F8B3U0_CERFI|nr:putative 26S proteasome regulatory subunit rpn9 [Ceratocystis platani]
MSFNEKIQDFLADQREAAPEQLQADILEFEDLWERKLWHQLTEKLQAFFKNPASTPCRLPFYNVFVLTFADKINQLKLVQLALNASTECPNNKERLAFLQDVAKRVDTADTRDAMVYASTAVARVKLNIPDLEGARKDLDSCQRLLDRLDSVEPFVHATFYDANASYYQRQNEFADYYRNALLYLACIDISTLSPKERHIRAYHLSVSALVSESIYNFGELLLHPILDALKDSENEWLRDLVFAFNRGDLVAFDRLSNHIESNNLLDEYSTHLRQKIYLASLTEAVFRRPPHGRTMSFKDISTATKVRPEEIEHLIMKALSLGLLRGTIDQVDEIAHITWVQPKVLDKKQVGEMRDRLIEWDQNVNELGNWIEKSGGDLWVA